MIRPLEQVVADAFAQAEARHPSHLRDWIVLVDGARHQLDLIHAESARREQVTICHRYLTGHLDQLHYDTALAAGWPIATGAVGGACRHLIADRLDITGARWGPDGAEAVLQLRALIANSDFEGYRVFHWGFHAACEHQRLCPSLDQQTYSLTA